ncbi:MAG: hypothetical protein U0359_28500 [Byssovorax sp.]
MPPSIEGATDASSLEANLRRLALPPREVRAAGLRALMGEADPRVRQLALGVRRTAHRHFDLHVVPLVQQHWPEVLGDPFFDKLSIGACDLYASAPYTALFCAPKGPLVLRAVASAGDLLPLPAPALSLLGRGAIEAWGRLAMPDVHRRIALVAAFIVVVDHVFDHGMDDPPRARGARLEAVIEGQTPPDGPALALTRALRVAMAERLDGDDRAAFEAAMAQVFGWIRAEVRAMLGEPDPRGLGHRMAGVEGTIDGLLFPVLKHTGSGPRAWMIDVSLFVQIMDDWLDAEADARSNRPTPVIEGRWTQADVEEAWARTVTGIEALARAAGHRSPRYQRFIRDAYVLMMREVAEAMIARPDA